MKPIILASGSPRRRELLDQLGLTYMVHPSDVEEVITKEIPSEIVEQLSQLKARSVAAQFSGNPSYADHVVLGADTIVALDNQVLGKPKDPEDAFRMLKSLSGRAHQVYTGVTLIPLWDPSAAVTFSDCTEVTMYPVSDDQIRSYIASGEPMDKAGSYGIQGLGAFLVRQIHGDYNNVVGLPVAHVYHQLSGWD